MKESLQSGLTLIPDLDPRVFESNMQPLEWTCQPRLALEMITLLDPKLQISSFPRDQIDRISHGLIKHLFFSGSKPLFFSLTENEMEISLIMDAEFKFPAYADQSSCSDVFRALQVELPKISALTEPLAQAGISIFYLSTFQSDFIFVREKRLALVYDLLVSAGFEFAEPFPSQSEPHPTVARQIAQYSPIALPGELAMTGLDVDFESEYGMDLIRVLFHSPNRGFFSFTHTHEGTSLITSKETILGLGLQPTRELKCIQVNLLDMDGYGVVHSMSKRLAGVGIDLLYLSTLKSGNVLVPCHDVETSIQLLLGY